MKINKKYIMSLLYLQTRELKNKVGHDIESQKCVLISKEFLDKYKNDNNYNNMKNSSDYLLNIADSGYEEQKKVLRQKYNIDENKLPVMDSILVIEINWSLEKQFLDIDNIEYPDKMEIISAKYFTDCFKGTTIKKKYEVYIVKDVIIFIDDNMVYLCSLIKGGENEYNFEIKVDILLKFQNPDIIKSQVDQIIKDGLINYFKFNNINKDLNTKQDLKNQIGFLINIGKEDEKNEIADKYILKYIPSKLSYENHLYLGQNENNGEANQKKENDQNNLGENNNKIGEGYGNSNNNQIGNFPNHNLKKEDNSFISNQNNDISDHNSNQNVEKKSNENNQHNNINNQDNQNNGNLNNNNVNVLINGNAQNQDSNLSNSNIKDNKGQSQEKLSKNPNYLSEGQMPNSNMPNNDNNQSNNNLP